MPKVSVKIELEPFEIRTILSLILKRKRALEKKLERQKTEGTYFVPEPGHRHLDEMKLGAWPILIDKLRAGLAEAREIDPKVWEFKEDEQNS